MQAEIITIGDEILIGQTVDTNSAWLGQRLNEVGVDVAQVRSVRDTPEAIVGALNALHEGTELVFLTGGLGPTKDDLTKHTLNDYFGGELEYHPEIYDHIVELFRSRGREPNAMNRGQAEIPNVSIPMHNPYGTASGMLFERNGIHYLSMPGVPYEMKGIMKESFLPWFMENFKIDPIVHKTILTAGVPESELAATLEDWENNLPAGLSLAYLPSAGMVKLRLTARKGNPDENTAMMEERFAEARELLGDCVYGEGVSTLEEVIGKMMTEMGVTVSTAESCTGGSIGSMLTSIPGSSAYFLGGIIAYANDVKVKTLGVNEADILMHGAVSEQVITQMARGAAKRMKSDYAIATSGIAGPDGGTDEKPVGTVWIAVHGPSGTKAEKFQFGHNRSRNIRRSVLMGMDMLRKELLKAQRERAKAEI
ncbi:competence/damage-inducible protein A [Phaeocystidibacter luteus]|uniref:CinA-like protein n=1 Tax=Phaeocystidibacter luteus TaxID=911197 RepID=A0A6N6RFN8_9FLAO|nr:competence/damage-inducible protein A [Phaeocystidibacter luteus]KAB2809962.1 competence/damage-inducible protein A [Phaeocystidibacter luteus]